jgi:N-hydroxyarylamine O-acetyltransferase
VEFVDRYLDRLGVKPGARPDVSFLKELHAAHLRAIPFENLSNHLGEAISLDPDALTDKILGRGRGGFCYELNGLFALLLEQLGYEVELLGARVAGEAGFGPPLDHLVLRVGASGAGLRAGSDPGRGDRLWLVDIGFGLNSLHPLAWEIGAEQQDPGGRFRLEMTECGEWDLYRDGAVQYRIEPNRRVLPDFAAMCWYHQNSPDSHFTKSLVCSRLTDQGRVTLSGRRLITYIGDRRQQLEVEDDQQLFATYRARFGIELDRLPTIPA